MTIAVDNTSNQTGAGVYSIQNQHICTGTDTNGILIVTVQVVDTTLADRIIDTVTHNGEACTHLASADSDDTVDGLRTEIWYRMNPTTGGTPNIVVSPTDRCTDLSYGAISFTGVDSTAPSLTTTANGASTDPTLNITTVGTDSWVVDSLSSGESGGTAKITAAHTSDGSPIHETDVGADFHGAQYVNAGGAGSQTMNWIDTDDDTRWVMSAIAIAAAATGTIYYETCAGVIATLTGAESALPKKLTKGGFTPAGGATKITKTIETGAVTPTGGAYKRTLTAIAGVIATITGAVSTKLIYIQLIAGTLTLAGDIKSFIAKKAVAGTLTPTGEGIVSLTRKFITGGLTLAGNAYKIVQTNVAGGLSFIGNSYKRTRPTTYTGGITPTGTTAYLPRKLISGTLTLAGGLAKLTKTLISGAITSVGDTARQFIGGGEVFYQTVEGTLTIAGDISSFIAKKTIAGTVSLAGALTRFSVKKIITGTLSFAGNLATKFDNFIQKAVGGVLTLSGSTTKWSTKAVAGTLSFVGDLVTVKKIVKIVTGGLTLTGSLTPFPKKLLTGTITLGGSAYKRWRGIVSGTLTLAGGLGTIKKIIKIVSGTLTLAGDLPTFTIKKIVSGGVTLAGSLVTKFDNFIQQAVGGVLTLGGATTKLVKPAVFIGILTPAGGVIKVTKAAIAGALTLAGALGTFYTAGTDIIYKTITGTLTLAGSTSNSISKKIAGTISLAGHAIRKTTRTLLGAITFAGSTNKITGITTTGVITFAGSLTTQLNELIHKLISGTLTIAGGTSITVQKIVSGGLTFAGSIGRFPKKLLTGVLTFDGNTYKLSTIIITGAITSAGGSAWLQKKLVGGSLSFSSILGLPDVHTLFHCPFGLGDGSTTFNLPDFRQSVAVGHYSGDADFQYMGQKGGEKQHTLTQAELPDGDTGAGTSHDHGGWSATSSHNHQPNVGTDFLTTVGSGGSYDRGSGTNATSSQYTNTEASHKHAITSDDSHTHSLGGSGTPFNVQQYYITVNKIIKT